MLCCSRCFCNLQEWEYICGWYDWLHTKPETINDLFRNRAYRTAPQVCALALVQLWDPNPNTVPITSNGSKETSRVLGEKLWQSHSRIIISFHIFWSRFRNSSYCWSHSRIVALWILPPYSLVLVCHFTSTFRDGNFCTHLSHYVVLPYNRSHHRNGKFWFHAWLSGKSFRSHDGWMVHNP